MGDEAAFGCLYDRFAPQLGIFLSRFVRDTTLAEDLLQTTFLSFVRARGRYVRTAGVRAFRIFTIAANAGRDALRRRGARHEDAGPPEVGQRGGGARPDRRSANGGTIERPCNSCRPISAKPSCCTRCAASVSRGRRCPGNDGLPPRCGPIAAISDSGCCWRHGRTHDRRQSSAAWAQPPGSTRRHGACPRGRAGRAAARAPRQIVAARRRGTVLVVLGTTALVMGLGAWLSIVEIDRVRRIVPLALLVAVQAWVSTPPSPREEAAALERRGPGGDSGRRDRQDRGAGTSPATPAIVCSTSHLAVDLIPLGLVLFALRRFSWTLGRSLLAGAAAATTGAIAGELSWAVASHALIHHVGAGLLIVVACAVISRILKPRSFAPQGPPSRGWQQHRVDDVDDAVRGFYIRLARTSSIRPSVPASSRRWRR